MRFIYFLHKFHWKSRSAVNRKNPIDPISRAQSLEFGWIDKKNPTSNEMEINEINYVTKLCLLVAFNHHYYLNKNIIALNYFNTSQLKLDSKFQTRHSAFNKKYPISYQPKRTKCRLSNVRYPFFISLFSITTIWMEISVVIWYRLQSLELEPVHSSFYLFILSSVENRMRWNWKK